MRYETGDMMRELTSDEMNEVVGGFFDFGNTVTQVNAVGAQIGVALGGAVAQLIQQGNSSNI
ncbi:MAG: hypothetical protein ABW110_07480 [Steroidobacteraceae bacterium]|jgi:hypothetical protein